MSILKFFIIVSLFFIVIIPSSAVANDLPWAFSFFSGPSTPTEDFNNRVEDDYCYGLCFEYMNLPYLGVHVKYVTRELDIASAFGNGDIQIDAFSVNAVVAYQFPKWFRVYGNAGPTYFYSQGQENIGLGDDSKDIGWNAGMGIEFYPIPRWGVRLHSDYNNSQLGTGNPRTTWLDTSLGLIFRF